MLLSVDYGQSGQNAINQIGAWVPKLVGAVIILLIGYVIARVVAKIVERALAGIGADRALSTSPAGRYRDRYAAGLRPSHVVGRVTFWFIFGLAILTAVSALGIQALSNAVASVTAYLPNVVAAILVLLVAVLVAGAIGALVQRLMAGTLLGKMVQTVLPTLIVTIALFMALVQLRIATQIVVATYVLVLGAIALGFALAFGLGGRDVAGQMLAAAYASGQDKGPQMRAEMQQAKSQAATDAEALRNRADPDQPQDSSESGFDQSNR